MATLAWPVAVVPPVDFQQLGLLLPVMLAFVGLLGSTITWMHVRRRTPVQTTRKIYHVVVFTVAAGLQVWFGTTAVLLYGVLNIASILYAVYRGPGFSFYDSLKRPDDDKALVVVPVLATAAGGIFICIFLPGQAHVGFLVAGWGDAAGELVGRTLGRAHFAVKQPGGLVARRTVEGSIAVAIVAAAGAFAAMVWTGTDPGTAARAAALIGPVAALAEALSGGGVDNLAMQVVGAGGAYVLAA
jgi:dolichol kinase